MMLVSTFGRYTPHGAAVLLRIESIIALERGLQPWPFYYHELHLSMRGGAFWSLGRSGKNGARISQKVSRFRYCMV